MPHASGMTRRRFLGRLAAAGLASALPGLAGSGAHPARPGSGCRLFLCGDVMTGRGVDQVLPHPSEPGIHESHVRDARDYVKLAEAESGPIPKPVDFDYVWGDAPAILESLAPRARVINLETAVTDHPEPWPDKGINYRMHPRNAPVLSALGADACVLANNHVLDWQAEGLHQTLATLEHAGLAVAGAGETLARARAPAAVPLGGGRRLLVFALASPTSGVPAQWAARPDRPGVHFLPDLSPARLEEISELVAAHRGPGDVVLVSVHWGGNWGYETPRDQQRFARGLIDEAGVDLVHGHSSHHPKGMEVHAGRLILYGCGDFLNDYEGIAGHEQFRPDLVAMYLPLLGESDPALRELLVVPLRIARMQLHRAGSDDAQWLAGRLNEYHPASGHRLAAEERELGGRPTPCLRLEWHSPD